MQNSTPRMKRGGSLSPMTCRSRVKSQRTTGSAAATRPAESSVGMLKDILDSLGLNPLVLAAGAAGGLLRALSSRRHTIREHIVSPLCGALAAGYLTATGVHLLRTFSVPLPFEDPQNTFGAVAFIIGVSAMWLSDAVMLIAMRRFGRTSEG